MKAKVPMVARILLGLIYFVFGLNGFFHFAPVPPMPDKAGAFLGALVATGYMFPFIKGTEVICGALLLSGRFVPLALAVLAPITLNILAFHLLLAPGGAGMAIFIVIAQGFLAWAYRGSFAGLLQSDAKPS